MAAKIKNHFSCQNCGHNSHKWLGRCPSCGEWSTFVEEVQQSATTLAPGSTFVLPKSQGIQPLVNPRAEEATDSTNSENRFTTGMNEFDRLLGGGIVQDSFILVGGDPGVGKSTLLLHVAAGLLQNHPKLKILYISGEESTEQIQARAARLKISSEASVGLLSETKLEAALAAIQEFQPQVVMVDSLQTFHVDYLESSPGSVGQLREITNKLMQLAKLSRMNIWLVGHVTKDGQIAGPKVVEHMVDTVLYFEGDHSNDLRILRTVKNRFGSVRELAVFEMEGIGLREIQNPSEYFLTQRSEAVSGTTVSPLLEGSRTLLIELQALVSPSSLANPRRTGSGVDHHRLSLWIAVLEKYLRIPLGQSDVFFNIAGGLRISEPAGDLAAIAAIYSSAVDFPFPTQWLWVGEIGLTGEIRKVSQVVSRLKEASKLGFEVAFISDREDLKRIQRELGANSTLEIRPLRHIQELKTLIEWKEKKKVKSTRADERASAQAPSFS